VHRLDNRSYAFIISTNLQSNDSLPSRRQKDLAQKDLSKELPPFETHFVLPQREAKPLESSAREDDRIQIVRGEFAQASWHIAAKIDHFAVRPFPARLLLPSHTPTG